MHFEVEDTGPGIPERELSTCSSATGRSEDEAGGVGLGLFISEEIVEAHGGRIFVESKLGRGTTFHFTIPASAAAAHVTATVQ